MDVPIEVPQSAITLDRLYRATKPVEVAERSLIVRALSSYDVKQRYDLAMLATVQVRRDMRNPLSSLYQINVSIVLEEISDADLRELIVSVAHQAAVIESIETIKPEFVPYPDDAKDEERRDVLEAREKAQTKANDLRDKFVKNKSDSKTAEIAAWSKAQLDGEYVRLVSRFTVDRAFGEAYEDAGLMFAVRNVDGSAYLESLSDARDLPSFVRQTLLSEMRLVNDLDPLRLNGRSSTATLPADGS